MTTKTMPNPAPWKMEKDGYIECADGNMVDFSYTSDGSYLDLRSRIVSAINSHDAFIEAADIVAPLLGEIAGSGSKYSDEAMAALSWVVRAVNLAKTEAKA